MAASLEDIKRWVNNREPKHTHMLVVCDEFDHEDYPVYVEKGEDALTIVKEYNKRSMQRVIEVYNFSLDIDMQLNQGRAYNL